MQVEQIYTGCLAHGAYYIASNGEAAIIDPLREVNPYVERAQKDWLCKLYRWISLDDFYFGFES